VHRKGSGRVRYELRDGDVYRIFVDGETAELFGVVDLVPEVYQMKNVHGKLIGYKQARELLSQRRIDNIMTTNLIVDVLLNSRQNGSEVVGTLLLAVSVAASCWLPEIGHDILARLSILNSRGTVEKVKAQFAKDYELAFRRDVKEAFEEMKAHDGAERPVSFSGQIDNYCKGVMARKLMAVAAGTNFKLVSTESRMLGRPLHNFLRVTDGGYGKKFNMTKVTGVLSDINDRGDLGFVSFGGSTSAWQLPLLNLATTWHEDIDRLPRDEAAGDKSRPYSLGNHLRAPQVSGIWYVVFSCYH